MNTTYKILPVTLAISSAIIWGYAASSAEEARRSLDLQALETAKNLSAISAAVGIFSGVWVIVIAIASVPEAFLKTIKAFKDGYSGPK